MRILGVAAILLAGMSGGVRIVLDGALEDWSAVPAGVRDAADAAGAEVDFGEVRAAHDARYVYLLIDLGHVVNPRGLTGTLSVLWDADGEAGTGEPAPGIAGVDLRVVSPAPGGGVELVTPAGRFPASQVGLRVAPTYAAQRMELRLDRGARVAGGPPLFGGGRFRVKLVYAEAGGRVMDETEALTYELTPVRETPATAGGADPLARAPGTGLRVLSWNVAGERMLKRPEPFQKILAAVRPDVVLFDEVSRESSAEKVERLLSQLPAPASAPRWRVVFGSAGGRQRTVVAARRLTLPSPALQWLNYPQPQSRELVESMSGAARQALASAHREGVPAVGAMVEFGARLLLAVPVDLQCCGDRPGGPEDRLRELEAATIHAAVLRALRGGGIQGTVVAGDLNLVASRAPLDRLAEGLDLNGGNLAIAESLRLPGQSNDTWSRRDSPFPPGRLDYLLYSESSLRLLRSFAFSTADLTEPWRKRHRLETGDSEAASDHLPLVADFQWRAARPKPRRAVR